VGINYFFNAEARLHGCVNDAMSIRELLLSKFGFTEENMLVLTDDSKNTDPKLKPTRANIIDAINWLAYGSKRGDTLFFSYSGHGAQTADLDNDEADGMDELILPCDYRTAGPIIDDDLHRILADPVPNGARLICVMDCCHSGTCLDLPFIYAGYGKLTQEKANNKITRGDVVLYSGCTDEQTSADSKELGREQVFSGVLTFGFCQYANASGYLTHATLLESIQKLCTSKGFTQTIQISSGKQFDLNTPFVI
jgi:hypothetical protein